MSVCTIFQPPTSHFVMTSILCHSSTTTTILLTPNKLLPMLVHPMSSGVSGRDSEDVATLLSSSWRKMRSLVLQKRNVQEFQFRQYLFAAQVGVHAVLHMYCTARFTTPRLHKPATADACYLQSGTQGPSSTTYLGSGLWCCKHLRQV